MQDERHRSRVCPSCNEEFSYAYGTGRSRVLCGKRACYNRRHKDLTAKRFAALVVSCSAPDCKNKATRVGSGLCENCYYRKRRTGSTDRPQIKGRYLTGSGYVKLLVPTHPLSDTKGLVSEHRKVMHDHTGGGDVPCHWCEDILSWSVHYRSPNAVVIDHLNENKSDNRLSNLVCSCTRCNRALGAMLPFIERLAPARWPEFAKRMSERVSVGRKSQRKAI